MFIFDIFFQILNIFGLWKPEQSGPILSWSSLAAVAVLGLGGSFLVIKKCRGKQNAKNMDEDTEEEEDFEEPPPQQRRRHVARY